MRRKTVAILALLVALPLTLGSGVALAQDPYPPCDEKALQEEQKQEEKEFKEQEKQENKAFEQEQKDEKEAFENQDPPPTKEEKKDFKEQQKSEKKAFEDQQKSEKEAIKEEHKSEKEACKESAKAGGNGGGDSDETSFTEPAGGFTLTVGMVSLAALAGVGILYIIRRRRFRSLTK